MVGIVKSSPFKLLYEIFCSNPQKIYRFVKGLKIFTLDDATVYELIKSEYSFIRWGDGETAIARGKFAWYQKFDKSLQDYLINLVSNPPKNTILGLPWAVSASPFDKRWNLRIFKIIFSTRIFIIRNTHAEIMKSLHFSTQDFWWRNSRDMLSILNNLLKDRECILITSDPNYLKLCPKGTAIITVPAINAFNQYEQIKNEIKSKISLFQTKPALLCAVGPTTKAIFLDFYTECQVLDIGHGFSFALNGINSWAWTKKG